jgi:hypothetical protein
MAYRKEQMEGDQKDGILEVECVIQVVVVHDHGRTEDDPYRNDCSSRELICQLVTLG